MSRTYHLVRNRREPNSRWLYLPVFIEKSKRIENFFERIPRNSRVLDMGCGEGHFMDLATRHGHTAFGVDNVYKGLSITTADVRQLPFCDGEFDAVLLCDVLEHMAFQDQSKVLSEAWRVLKPGGDIFISVPNLAHLISRFSFLLLGRLIRTSSIDRHVGDRPYSETSKLIQNFFDVNLEVGLFPTEPLLCLATLVSPRQSLILHRIYNFIFPFPSLCFLVCYEATKPKTEPN